MLLRDYLLGVGRGRRSECGNLAIRAIVTRNSQTHKIDTTKLTGTHIAHNTHRKSMGVETNSQYSHGKTNQRAD